MVAKVRLTPAYYLKIIVYVIFVLISFIVCALFYRDFAGLLARGTPILIEEASEEEKMKYAPEHEERAQKMDDRAPYEPPAIIYKGKISTRAGSPFPRPDESTTVVDPADLFGDE